MVVVPAQPKVASAGKGRGNFHMPRRRYAFVGDDNTLCDAVAEHVRGIAIVTDARRPFEEKGSCARQRSRQRARLMVASYLVAILPGHASFRRRAPHRSVLPSMYVGALLLETGGFATRVQRTLGLPHVLLSRRLQHSSSMAEATFW